MNAKIKFGILTLIVFVSLILTLLIRDLPSQLSQPVQKSTNIQPGESTGDSSLVAPLILTDEQGKYPLGLHLELLEDPGGKLTIDQVSSPELSFRFIPSQVETPNFGFTKSVYWVRLPLENETRRTDEWLLEIGYVNTQYVDLYTPHPDGSGFLVKQTGSLRPISTRDVLYPRIIFSLILPPGSQQTYYLRFQSEASMTLPLTLWTKDVFWTQAQTKMMEYWLFFGAILALLVYHLFLLMSLRETSYQFFVLLLATVFAFFSAFEGYLGVFIIPQLYTIKSYFLIAFAAMFASLILFSDAFLELKRRHPRFHWIHMGMAACWGVILLLLPVASYHTMATLLSPWALVCMLTSCIGGTLSWLKGFRPARLFIFAWLGLLASLSLLLLVRLGFVQSTVFTETAYQPGLLLMAVLWSFALADRINLLKAETDHAVQKLQRSERRLSQILDGVPLGITVYGKDQKPEYVNRRAVEILSNPEQGIRPGVNARRTLAQALEYYNFHIRGTKVKYPLEKLPIFGALKGLPASVDDLEADLIDRAVPIEMWASPVTDSEGNVEAAVAAFQDITQRKQEETELAEYRKRLETMVERRTTELNAANRELRLRLEWLEAVNLVNQTVAGSTDFTQIYEKVVDIARQVFKVQDAFIAETDANGKQLMILAHTCRQDHRTALVGSIATLPEGIPSHSNLPQGRFAYMTQDRVSLIDGPLGEHIRVSDLQGIIGIPLQLREQVLGFLGLEISEDERTISREEYNLLNIFATDIAQILLNAQLFEQAKLSVAAEERNRLARELHDSVAQALYSISLYAEAIRLARQGNKQEVVEEHTDEMMKLSREAMGYMRLLIYQLRPPILEDEGLVVALQSRLDSVEARANLKAHLETKGIFKLTPEQESELYWIAQEILNNVLKHAQAGEVKVQLIQEAGCFRMVIEDDGVGFEPEVAEQAGGQGLRNIQERAKKIGATCTISSAPGHGTKITLEMVGSN